MATTDRRRLTMAEMAPGQVTLFLVSGDSETSQEGYVLCENMTVVEAVQLWRRILRDHPAWLAGLLPEPWQRASFKARLRDHGSAEIVLPGRKGGWPQ